MHQSDLLVMTPKGLYCPAGDFFIDPVKKVARAVITHAHSDHVSAGCKAYLTARKGVHVLRSRVAKKAHVEFIEYGESLKVNGVSLSFHPAGHILGSSQVRLEHQGCVWVVSGDYKTQPDPTCSALEPVACHVFISESTFALPVYRWPCADRVMQEINRWWLNNKLKGITSFLHVYSLGKAQRILASINCDIGPIYVHKAVGKINQAYQVSGVALPAARLLTPESFADPDFSGALVIGPVGDPDEITCGAPSSLGVASGWMRTRRNRKTTRVDRVFILSDHADWNGLLESITATGAERVLIMNGFADELARWLRESGLDAENVSRLTRTVPRGIFDLPEEAHFHFREAPLPDAIAPLARSIDKKPALRPSFGEMLRQMDCSREGRVTALIDYVANAAGDEFALAARLLSGNSPGGIASIATLRALALECSKIPEWLYRACHRECGEVIETISLLLPDKFDSSSEVAQLSQMVSRIESLGKLDASVRGQAIAAFWSDMDADTRIAFNHVMAGSLPSNDLLACAVSRLTGMDERVATLWLKNEVIDLSKDFHVAELSARMPVTFHPEKQLDRIPDGMVSDGDAGQLVAQLRYAGIRAQLVKVDGEVLLWSNQQELLSQIFTEIVEAAADLPDGTCLEGDILGWRDADVLPYNLLQRRAKNPENKKVKQDVPVIFMACDIIRWHGEDLSKLPFIDRRAKLEEALTRTAGLPDTQIRQLTLFSPCLLQLSPALRLAPCWTLQDQQHVYERLRYAEMVASDGLLIKHSHSAYGPAHQEWLHVRPQPVLLNAALVSIRVPRMKDEQPEFTMAVFKGDELVPIAKLPSLDLDEGQSARLKDFIRENTTEKFGPVRVVRPEMVFELACGGVQPSSRHKAGLTVRYSRVIRWCGSSDQYPVHSLDALLKSRRPAAGVALDPN